MTACLWQLFPERSAQQVIGAVRLAGANYNQPDKQLGYGITNFIYAYNFLAQFGLDEDIFILPERAISKSGPIKIYYSASRIDPSFDIETRLMDDDTGTVQTFKMKKNGGAFKVKLPKIPAGKDHAIALLKVTDHDYNTTYVCMIGIVKK